MRTSFIGGTSGVVLAAAFLAGCTAPEPVPPQLQRALTAPDAAEDCRMIYREASKRNRQSSGTTQAPGGLAGVLAVAIVKGVANGMAERRITNELVACYDAVGAPPDQRLPARGPNAPTAEQDLAAILGEAPAPTGQPVAPAVNADRSGPGGGAGFGSY